MVIESRSIHFRFFTDDKSVKTLRRLQHISKFLGKNSAAEADIEVENCYHLIAEAESEEDFISQYYKRLCWLLCEDIFEKNLRKQSKFLDSDCVLEVGPRLAFTTPFSTNAVSACVAAGIKGVKRLEMSKRYLFRGVTQKLVREQILPLIHDRMTECEYDKDVCFENFRKPEKHFTVDLIASKENLRDASTTLGLAFDEDDINYYYDLFVNKLKRNPTDVELFDLAQSNSEHSRHTFFKGRLFIDGKEREETLFRSVQRTQEYSTSNNVIAFSDNSSAIYGFTTKCFKPSNPTSWSILDYSTGMRHIIYSAETHNFPTGVSPFPGAATGTGGRIRDVHATGRGAHEIAGIAGYSVGNLLLDGYDLEWEDAFSYPENMACPKKILIEASNGASDYGNKFGEPVICGFTRSFGQKLPDGQRCEYVKPILFSAGIGCIDEIQVKKKKPEFGMYLAKIGGPAYRIGMGGGTASSVNIQGHEERDASLDFCAVQRGDPEMEQKLHRVVRGCVELGDKNPILSIHDQGAGGNGNVLKELIGSECGAVIEASKFQLGDPTLSIRELWCAEYQENDAILVDPSLVNMLELVAKREKCNLSIIGRLDAASMVTVVDYDGESSNPPFSIPSALAERPPKEFHLNTLKDFSCPLRISNELSVLHALSLVLRLPSVASKRFLTNKVDRSVTGLIAQQQCTGPLETPVADVAVVALSYSDIVGGAVAVGEQPIKGIISPESGARMSLAEALTNLVFAPITDRKDIKCSGNWMWAAKLSGEGARLTRACDALCDAMNTVGVAIDGGKDSLSMAAQVGGKVVKAPGTIVVSAYAPCLDITKVITPDLKGASDGGPSHLIYVRFGNDGLSHRLGGSALAQCLKQVGDAPSDVEDFNKFSRAFDILQKLIKKERVLSGHDVSDGGLITCALEMAIAGNRSMVLQLMSNSGVLDTLFAEEAGVILEVERREAKEIKNIFDAFDIFAEDVGFAMNDSGPDAIVAVRVNSVEVLCEPLRRLRLMWEETSYQLELLQTDLKCAEEQKLWLTEAKNPVYKANYDFSFCKTDLCDPRALSEARGESLGTRKVYSVAIVREEGSNGDREMAAAFHAAGFSVFDLTTEDFLRPEFSLRYFKGLVFVGGFSYADVLGAAKGWASLIMHHKKVLNEMEDFRKRRDTFSLGVCNGCQLMTLLGWVGCDTIGSERVHLRENDCGRFQSSFSSVFIDKSPSIFFQAMEKSVLGVWSSHGEGKFCFKDESTLSELEKNNLVPLRYCDAEGKPTMRFPQNPNGSYRSIAAICSADGRHLAMMPHPERSYQSWQWPYYPRELRANKFNAYKHSINSPWMRMFSNAYNWLLMIDFCDG